MTTVFLNNQYYKRRVDRAVVQQYSLDRLIGREADSSQCGGKLV